MDLGRPASEHAPHLEMTCSQPLWLQAGMCSEAAPGDRLHDEHRKPSEQCANGVLGPSRHPMGADCHLLSWRRMRRQPDQL